MSQQERKDEDIDFELQLSPRDAKLPDLQIGELPELNHQNTILSNLSNNGDQNSYPFSDFSKITENPQSEGSEQIEVCQLHEKVKDIICETDACRICTHCVIFGQHKNHKIKQQSDFNEDKKKLIKNINEIKKMKQDLDNQAVNIKELVLIKNKKKQILNKVQTAFIQIRKTIDNMQISAKNKIQQFSRSIEKSTQEQIISFQTDINNKINTWISKSSINFIKTLEQGEMSQQLHILYKDKRELNFANDTIKAYLEKIEQIYDSIEGEMSLIKINVNDKIKDTLQNYVSVTNKIQLELMPLPNLTNYPSNIEQFLIEKQEIKPYMISINKESEKQIPSQSDDRPNTSFSSTNIPKQSNSFYEITKSLNDVSFRSDQKQKKKPISQTKILKSASKKSSSNKPPILSQKYQKIYKNLISDNLQTLDLTNAQLGNSTCISFLKHIPQSKCKNIKLINNKISDQGLSKMLPYFYNIISLNLSQNTLTDESLNLIIKHLDNFERLQSLTLSLNKIKQRNVREQIEVIKKKNVIVSL